jgi:hypothetical protein
MKSMLPLSRYTQCVIQELLLPLCRRKEFQNVFTTILTIPSSFSHFKNFATTIRSFFHSLVRRRSASLSRIPCDSDKTPPDKEKKIGVLG